MARRATKSSRTILAALGLALVSAAGCGGGQKGNAPPPGVSAVPDARVPIEDFEARVGEVLDQEERDEVDTLGGLVFSLAGRVPSRGELLTHPSSGLEFEIIDADPRRIKRIRVRNPPPPDSK